MAVTRGRQHMHDTNTFHSSYLKGTPYYGLVYTHRVELHLQSFSELNWSGDTVTRRCTCSMSFFNSGGLIAGRGKKESCVALCSTKAEYKALGGAVCEATWLKTFFI